MQTLTSPAWLGCKQEVLSTHLLLQAIDCKHCCARFRRHGIVSVMGTVQQDNDRSLHQEGLLQDGSQRGQTLKEVDL